MSATNDILDSLDLSQLASYLGTDEDTAKSAIEQAVPALLHGLEGEAADPDAATGLTNALAAHHNGLVGSGTPVDPNEIDTEDGTKIVAHIFGNQPQATTNANALLGGLGGTLVKKLLPILAPMVMSWLANQLLNHPTVQKTQNQAQTSNASSGGLGDILGDVLGSVLGGGQQTQSTRQTQQGSGGGLGDILGSVLGGAGGAGGLGSILGSILGSGGAPQAEQIPQYEQPTFGQNTTKTTTGKIQIEADEPGAPAQQNANAGDVLGNILGSILGR